MHPRQASVLIQANDLRDRLAAKKQTEKKQQAGGKTAVPTLWKYTCPDTSKDFYLTEKRTSVKCPECGKSHSMKAEKFSLSDVGKELKSDAKAEKAAK